MSNQQAAAPRKKLSCKAKIIIISVFTVLWLGVSIYEQVRFAADPARGAIEEIGDYTQLAIPAAGLAGSLIIGDVTGAFQFVLGCSANLVVTTVMKQTIDAPRPNGLPHSFPSGHTAFAFQGATFILRRFGWRLGIIALLLAAFVGFSRVEGQKHWVHDVVAGAVIGAACSAIFTRPLRTKQ